MTSNNKFAEEDAMGYRIEMVGRNVVITEAIRNYFWTKINKIERFHNHILDLHVNITLNRLEYDVVVILMFNNTKIKVEASSTDLYSSIDRVISKLEKKVLRWKERIKEHHNTPRKVVDMMVNVVRRPYDEVAEYNAEIEAENLHDLEKLYQPPTVIGTEKRMLKVLTTDDAVMKIELSGDAFMLFRDQHDNRLKVIYRRSDGNYGIIQPE